MAAAQHSTTPHSAPQSTSTSALVLSRAVMDPSPLDSGCAPGDDEHLSNAFMEDKNASDLESGIHVLIDVIKSTLAHPGISVFSDEAVHRMKSHLYAPHAIQQQDVIAPSTAITHDCGFTKLQTLTNNGGVGSFTASHQNSLSLDTLQNSDAVTLITVAIGLFSCTFISHYAQVLPFIAKSAISASETPNKSPPRPVPKPHPSGPHQSGTGTPNALQPRGTLDSNEGRSHHASHTTSNQPPPRPAPKPFPTGLHQSTLTKPNKPPPRPEPKPYPSGPPQS